MKYTLTIEGSFADLQVLLERIGGTGPEENRTPVEILEAPAPFPDDQQREAAASPPEPKPARKEKKAARVRKNGPEPEAAAEVAEAPGAEQNVPQLADLKKAITDAVLAEKRAAKTHTLRDMVETLKEDTGLDFVMSAKDEHRDALYAFTQKAGITLA